MTNNMKEYLSGKKVDNEETLRLLREEIFPQAVELMNRSTLPMEFSLFDVDQVPTNQRNLTDVRTRMGVLLEYELAKAVSAVLLTPLREELVLNYVIAQKFPDLAFRTWDGGIGVRFEVKGIETIAEEKSANFDTLLKDIRKGTDFVVVMLWEWNRHTSKPMRHPLIDAIFVLDAYELARMRDCYWLNCPPKNVGDGRQGFDLCFGVNCRAGQYNREEGNYGKLMRIFNKGYEEYLPESVKKGTTLKSYYDCCEVTIRLGLERVGLEIASAFASSNKTHKIELLSKGLPVFILSETEDSRFLIAGSDSMPSKKDVSDMMDTTKTSKIMTLNAKFDWRVRDNNWVQLASGRKPEEAKVWAQSEMDTGH